MKESIYEYGAEMIAVVSAILFFAILSKLIDTGDTGIISSFIVFISNLSV